MPAHKENGADRLPRPPRCPCFMYPPPPGRSDALAHLAGRRFGESYFGASALKSTRSRNSLPALKCGTNFCGTCTFSPDFGLRPVRGGR